MATEHIVVGPPGCGKTTWVARQVEIANERYGPDKSLVVSLTRGAARAAAGKTNLSRHRVGTLHSHCFRALGQPRVVTAGVIKAWNEQHPNWQLSPGAAVSEEGGGADEPARETWGDRLMAAYERARHLRLPLPSAVRPFSEAWADHKIQAGDAFDFTDMIERALTELPLPPGQPSFLLADEAQDLSPLELALLRRWSAHVEHFALVGDPNQSIYHWRHSSDELSRCTPTIVLGQSYRVPRTVQAAAVAVAERAKTHLAAAYSPRDEEGACLAVDFGWPAAERLISWLHQRPAGDEVMVLASCGYMLTPLLTVMRNLGVPFHNPYRVADGKWNPLARGTERRRTAVDRLGAMLAAADFFSGEPSAAPPAGWQLELLSRSLLRSAVTESASEVAGSLSQRDANPAEVLRAMGRMFTPAAKEALATGNVDWLASNSKTTVKRSLAYPLRVFKNRGREGLAKPNLIVGTIHSVKGGEADHVLLAPDLSPQGWANYRQEGWDRRDGVIRTFYVGMTRARKTLTVMRANGWALDLLAPLRGQSLG